jgi:ribosomal protein S18 acetylase RimI-like enzyme
MDFAIEPYASVGPVRFGASEDQVQAVLGEPRSSSKSERNPDERSVWYRDARVSFDADGVAEISLAPPSTVTLGGYNLFEDGDAWRKLCALDGAPGEVVGFLVLKNLGVALTGLHDGDESQLAVTAFRRGSWDSLAMKPFAAHYVVI